MTTSSKCRFCGAPLQMTFVDLGMSPLSNSYVAVEQARRMEPFYPLHVYVCDACFLVQLEEFESPDHIFSDYAYFSSYSQSWLDHARAYAHAMIPRLGLTTHSQVVEIASNDGYLLQYFQQQGIPVLGIEPAANVAAVAVQKGIESRVAFFGSETARQLVDDGLDADLIAANNVLAHVPDINDFVRGFAIALKPGGTITVEFPHLLRLIEHAQFDTIYHEHFSYLSLGVVNRIFAHHGLTVFDVEELSTHGGSLRVFARHTDGDDRPVTEGVEKVLGDEQSRSMDSLEGYTGFETKVQDVRRDLLRFLLDARDEGRTVAGYGAPAKGNTLLNYCGVRRDLIPFTVDMNPAKQSTLLPGTRIPVRSPEALAEARPDYVLVLPWNLREEIETQHGYIRDWGGRFVVPIPRLEIF